MSKINYDAINFKNKDVDKFATKFGNGDDPIIQGIEQRKKDQEKKDLLKENGGDPIRAGIAQRKKDQERATNEKSAQRMNEIVNPSPAQVKAFDEKRKKQHQNYLNSMDSWLDAGAKPNYAKGIQNAVKNTEKGLKKLHDKKEAYLKSKGI